MDGSGATGPGAGFTSRESHGGSLSREAKNAAGWCPSARTGDLPMSPLERTPTNTSDLGSLQPWSGLLCDSRSSSFISQDPKSELRIGDKVSSVFLMVVPCTQLQGPLRKQFCLECLCRVRVNDFPDVGRELRC